jgi:hypothetical protein
LDDQRTDTIIREHVALPTELWTELQYHDVYISGDEAVKFGVATEIGDFSPPPGTQVFNLLG